MESESPSSSVQQEEWRPVLGYEGLYEVSNVGRVRRALRLLKPVIGTLGYQQVGLCRSGVQKNVKVHRLVAEAFLDRDPSLPHVNHKDGLKHNNCVSNLEWTDATGNLRHAVETGLHGMFGESNPNARLSDEEVAAIRAAPGRHRDIAARYGICPTYVGKLKSRIKRQLDQTPIP